MVNSTLKNVCGYSFPGNHLLQLSLVQQPQEQVYKKEYFFFLTCAPGEQSQSGGRTFNFQNKFTIKMDVDKLASLRHALIMYATGRKSLIGQFSIFANSGLSSFNTGGGTKSIFLNDGKDNKGNPTLSLTFKLGSSKGFAFQMLIPNALAITDIMQTMITKALDLEFSRTNIQLQPSVIKVNESINNQQETFNNNVQQPNTVPNNTQSNITTNFAESLNNLGQQPVTNQKDIPF